MVDGLADASKDQIHVLNALGRPPSLSVEPSQRNFDSVMSRFRTEEILKEKKNQKLWNVLVHNCAESLEEELESTVRARYSSVIEQTD